MATTNDQTNKWSSSSVISPPPDSDAIKLLQFLDTAALSIKIALEKSSKPKRKRFLKDSSETYCQKRFEKSASSLSNAKSTDRHHGKIWAQQNAEESINSLFDIVPLKALTGQQDTNTPRIENSKGSQWDSSLTNRDLPLSFFVEPALRDKSQPIVELSVDYSKISSQTCNSGMLDNFLHPPFEGSPVSVDNYEDMCLKSPSLPEDTLESILDQGEINDLLGNGWRQEAGEGHGVVRFFSSDCSNSSTGSCAMSTEMSSAASASPRCCSESSRDSFFSQPSAPPMACDWSTLHDSNLTKQPWSPSLLQTFKPYSASDCVLFQNHMPPFQTSDYQHDKADNLEENRIFNRYQTGRGADDHCVTYSAPYFNWGDKQTQEHAKCFPSPIWYNGLSPDNTQHKNQIPLNHQWSNQYYPPLTWSANLSPHVKSPSKPYILESTH